MRKIILPLSVIAAACLMLNVSAQKTTKADGKKPVPAAGQKLPPVPVVNTYLGMSGMMEGEMRKGQFDSFAKQGLTLGITEVGGFIKSFDFMYAERALYEDSAGNPLRLTDYLIETCNGSQLSAGIQSSIYERTKPGDTAFFSDIRVKLASGLSARGRNMKFVIVK